MSRDEVDENKLASWLESATGRTGEVHVSPMRGGGSCEMFLLQQGNDQLVIRRAPLSAVSDSAHDVMREYQIIDALSGSVARVPELITCCDDRTILGAPFYIMRYIDGEVIRAKLPEAYQASPETQQNIGEEIIDALIELHSVKWQGSKLEELAKPHNFLQRQVERWMAQLESYRSRDLAAVDDVAKWLEQNRPVKGELTVMHGDYKVDNAMYSRDVPPRVLSLLDFEMTTIGDPLIDLAWCMIFWPEEGSMIAIASPDTPGGMDARYCQSPQTLVDRYAVATGRDISQFQWYQAFAAWKLGIVLEGSYARYLKGESKNPHHEFFGFVVEQLMLRARRFAV